MSDSVTCDSVTCEPEVKVSITPVCTISLADVQTLRFFLEQCKYPKISYKHGDSPIDIANKVIAVMLDQVNSMQWTLDKAFPDKREGAK